MANNTYRHVSPGSIPTQFPKDIDNIFNGNKFDQYQDKYDRICNPDLGELDIVETIHSTDYYEATYHWQTQLDEFGTCKYPTNHRAATFQLPLNRKEYHDFDIEWGPDYIDHYLDGKLVRHWDIYSTLDYKNRSMLELSNAPYFLILNSAYGEGMAGPLNTTFVEKYAPDAFYFKVDHVKVLKYQPR
jgi:beta-glucanase (GH16 family)